MTSNPVDLAANQVAIWNASFTNQTGQAATDDNADSSVFTVSPNRAASLVGSGPLGAPLQPEFGSVDFRAYNLNVSNRAVREASPPSLPPSFSDLRSPFRRLMASRSLARTRDPRRRSSLRTPMLRSTAALSRVTRTRFTLGEMPRHSLRVASSAARRTS
jgi:hypothetical protein